MDIVNAVEYLVLKGFNAGQIYRELIRRPEFEGRVPSDKTIERYVKEKTPPDPSGPWSLREATLDEVSPLFDVLEAVITATEGRRTWISREEAAWSLRILRRAPDLHPFAVYFIARQYMLHKEQQKVAIALDAFLAFTPWRSAEHLAAYDKATADGWFPLSFVGHAVAYLQTAGKPHRLGGTVGADGQVSEIRLEALGMEGHSHGGE